MAISAQTLFHFTEYEHLQKILQTKAFYPRFCFESFINQDDFVVAFPMSCFCDIPLSQISTHAESYHNNGIGLSKSWGINRGINPVFYLQKESYPSRLILDAFKAMFLKIKPVAEGNMALQTDNPDFIKKFMDLTSYFKPREGKTWDKFAGSFVKYTGALDTDKLFNFYDEREWRFVPWSGEEITTSKINLNFRPKEQFYSGGKFLETKFKEANQSLQKSPLSFEALDIKYIIVAKKSYVNFMAKYIRKLPTEVYSEDEKNVLISKIISLTQIKEDF
ncbi:MAG: hypothetical protein K0B15_09890 [Lentimicrobium sp.]|nr:hypothetical protein [Lentimicrobium sp.]